LSFLRRVATAEVEVTTAAIVAAVRNLLLRKIIAAAVRDLLLRKIVAAVVRNLLLRKIVAVVRDPLRLNRDLLRPNSAEEVSPREVTQLPTQIKDQHLAAVVDKPIDLKRSKEVPPKVVSFNPHERFTPFGHQLDCSTDQEKSARP
jgi:hypothetical protein